MSREHSIVDDYMQEEYVRPCVNNWANVILELHDSGKEMHAKQIVKLLHAEIFELDGRPET